MEGTPVMDARFDVRASVGFALCGSEAKERMGCGGPGGSECLACEEKKSRR